MTRVVFDLAPSPVAGRVRLWILLDGFRVAFTTMNNEAATAVQVALATGEYEVTGEVPDVRVYAEGESE